MVGVVKYVRVQVESAANIYNDIRLAILRTAHTAVDPNIASDLMQKVKIYKKSFSLLLKAFNQKFRLKCPCNIEPVYQMA